MSLDILIIFLIGIVGFYLWEVVVCHYAVKPISPNTIDLSKHCVIDIRDFITSHRSPITCGENIPLSYLSRTTREKGICHKDIVFVTDDRKAAGKAARIVSKRGNKGKQQFYFTEM